MIALGSTWVLALDRVVHRCRDNVRLRSRHSKNRLSDHAPIAMCRSCFILGLFACVNFVLLVLACAWACGGAGSWIGRARRSVGRVKLCECVVGVYVDLSPPSYRNVGEGRWRGGIGHGGVVQCGGEWKEGAMSGGVYCPDGEPDSDIRYTGAAFSASWWAIFMNSERRTNSIPAARRHSID